MNVVHLSTFLSSFNRTILRVEMALERQLLPLQLSLYDVNSKEM